MRRRRKQILDASGMGLAQKLTYANSRPMARVLEEQRLDPAMRNLDFEERLSRMVDAEIDEMNTRKMNRLIKQGHFPFPGAHMANVLTYSGRPLNMQLLYDLAGCDYIEKGKGVVLCGPTGGGKTYISCALAISACQRGYRALYLRTPELLDDLRLANEQRRLVEYVKYFNRYDLLILDEWMTKPVTPDVIYPLMDFLDCRFGGEEKRSIIFCSLFDMDDWYDRMKQYGAEIPGVESSLDRIVYNCYCIEVMSDESMRKVLSDLRQQGDTTENQKQGDATEDQQS